MARIRFPGVLRINVRYRTPSTVPRCAGRPGVSLSWHLRHCGFWSARTLSEARATWNNESRMPCPRCSGTIFSRQGLVAATSNCHPAPARLRRRKNHRRSENGPDNRDELGTSGFQATVADRPFQRRAIQPGLVILANSNSLYNRGARFAIGNHPPGCFSAEKSAIPSQFTPFLPTGQPCRPILMDDSTQNSAKKSKKW